MATPVNTNSGSLPLHTLEVLRRTPLNRAFAVIYTCAIFILFYHHTLTLLTFTTTSSSLFLRLSLLVADFVLAFMWATTQAYRIRPVRRRTFPNNLVSMIDGGNYPRLDVFICTADPYKEPPMRVVNTALSVMAYEYPTDKISVYVSDDGGSKLTLFAFMEAARFACYWLPFCKENRLMERCPEAYFSNNQYISSYSKVHEEIKMMYETMKEKVEKVLERGHVDDEYIRNTHEHEALSKWNSGFTRQDHPTIIQVLLESGKDKEIKDHEMPNLVYISREKSNVSQHHFKAGALNVLLRVSAAMTNAPLLLTLDCDMYSNDPQTPLRALCYLWEPSNKGLERAYVQFPQRFRGINKHDIYASELKRLFQLNPIGMDGLQGTSYVGTGCFFRRRALFGGPSSSPLYLGETTEQSSNHIIEKSIQSKEVLTMVHHVATCNYEDGTDWGSKIGFRYGSLVEDYYTGYQLQCEGWKTVFCDPDREAFLGDVPINLNDALSQNKRWAVGLLQVAFSKHSPVTFGIKSMGLFMGLSYAHYAFWAIWSIPITLYAFLPPLALLNGLSMFPKVTDSLFYLYVFLFLGAYAQDGIDFILKQATIRRWWNDQRMWMIRGVSSYLFGSIDFLFQSLGISAFGFNVTSKVLDEEQSKKYEQGVFEFGVTSPLLVPMTTAAIINLIAFVTGVARVFKHGNLDEVFVQLFISGFIVLNCWPIYEAIALRTDKGRMTTKTTTISIFIVGIMSFVASLMVKERN